MVSMIDGFEIKVADPKFFWIVFLYYNFFLSIISSHVNRKTIPKFIRGAYIGIHLLI